MQIMVIPLAGREPRCNALRKRIQCRRHRGITNWQTSLLTTGGEIHLIGLITFIFKPEELHAQLDAAAGFLAFLGIIEGDTTREEKFTDLELLFCGDIFFAEGCGYRADYTLPTQNVAGRDVGCISTNRRCR